MHSPNEVIKKYSKAIFKVANTYYNDNPRFSYEDLLSEAKVAAVKACNSYNEANDASFFTFLTSAMNNEVQKFVKNNNHDLRVTEHQQREEFKKTGNVDKINTEARAVSLNYYTQDGKDGSERIAGSIIASSGSLAPNIALIKEESLQILREEMSYLPDREREVLSDNG